MQKILAVVKFNDGEAFVMSEPIELVWNKQKQKDGSDILIASDGIFCDCLYIDRSWKYPEAFAGRKFIKTMKDGEQIKCEGQFWSGWRWPATEMYPETRHVTAAHIGDLKSCYVFFGWRGINSEIDRLRKAYRGPVYEYFDYDYLLNGRKLRPYDGRRYRRQLRKSKSIFTKHTQSPSSNNH